MATIPMAGAGVARGLGRATTAAVPTLPAIESGPCLLLPEGDTIAKQVKGNFLHGKPTVRHPDSGPPRQRRSTPNATQIEPKPFSPTECDILSVTTLLSCLRFPMLRYLTTTSKSSFLSLQKPFLKQKLSQARVSGLLDTFSEPQNAL